jgi:3-hydroxymyristoyl/3-hydroxydecanoyl-(acyl carrier protein) dehydratase
MRWRFVDRIEEFEPWALMRGRKAISLVEYFLLNPFGRKGVFPETLVIESCIHLVRWLVMRSSGFKSTCLLSDLGNFNFNNEVGMGDILRMGVTVTMRREDSVQVNCETTNGERLIGYGALTVGLMDLTGVADPEVMKAMWQELYVKA